MQERVEAAASMASSVPLLERLTAKRERELAVSSVRREHARCVEMNEPRSCGFMDG